MAADRQAIGIRSITRLRSKAFFSRLNPSPWASPGSGDDWRQHIDGLRAISVLAVVFYHSRFISGGFVGVDVFFVISGFLISKIIYAEIKSHGKFRIISFYERRARRILPVFVIVTAATVITGYFLFLPDDFAVLGRSAMYASGFSANLFDYRTSGYFDEEADTYPLLHFWSLGVEEQFYIAFPVIVLLIWKLAPRLIGATIFLIAVASLALAEICVRTQPAAAFYLTPQRAWELMAGCMLALPGFPFLNQRLPREIVSAAGLGLILFAALSYGNETPFPGLTAVVPVAGAASIIWGCEGRQTFVGALLSLKPLRYLGLWSYSIYMIHWPIIVFARVLRPFSDGRLDVIIVLASIGLGCLSYFFVEAPFRKPRQILSRRSLFEVSLASLLALAGSGLIIETANGFPDWLPKEVRTVLAYNDYEFFSLYRHGVCFLVIPKQWKDLKPDCLPTGRPSALLWGDSHAAHFYAALKDRFPDVSMLQANMSACPPIVGLPHADLPNCKSFNQLVLDWTMANKPDVVILSAGWPRNRDTVSLLDGTVKPLLSVGLPVIIFGETPNYRHRVPDILARRLLRGDHDIRAEDEYTDDTIRLDRYMKSRYGSMQGVRYISFQDAFCLGSECPLATESGIPIYWDNDHFTREGADLVVKHFFADDGLFQSAK
jgi:peptidoglycan/LPS O-acetylase OafA/YrhL